MSGIETNSLAVVPETMLDKDKQTWLGIALLVLAGALLFGPVALGLPFTQTAGAIAVLGLAGGAILVGTAEEGRPV